MAKASLCTTGSPSHARRLALVSTVSAVALIASTAQSRTLPTDGVHVDLTSPGMVASGKMLPGRGAEVDLTVAPQLTEDLAVDAAAKIDSAPAPMARPQLASLTDAGADTSDVVRDVDADLADLLDRAKTLAAAADQPEHAVPAVLQNEAAAARVKATAEPGLWLPVLLEEGALQPIADARTPVIVTKTVATAPVRPSSAARELPQEIASVTGDTLRVTTRPADAPIEVRPMHDAATLEAPASAEVVSVVAPAPAKVADVPTRPLHDAATLEAPVEADVASVELPAVAPMQVAVVADAASDTPAADIMVPTPKSKPHVKNLPWLKKKAKPVVASDVTVTPVAPIAAAAVEEVPARVSDHGQMLQAVAGILEVATEADATAPVVTEAPAVAAELPEQPQDEALKELTVAAVSDGELSEMRAGFNIGGMEFSFGIQAATFVNGALQASYAFTSDDLAPLTSGSGIDVSGAAPQQVIQVGDGNTAPANFNFNGPITVIQNTTSGAFIQHVASISIDVTGFNSSVARSLPGSFNPALLSLGFSNN